MKGRSGLQVAGRRVARHWGGSICFHLIHIGFLSFCASDSVGFGVVFRPEALLVVLDFVRPLERQVLSQELLSSIFFLPGGYSVVSVSRLLRKNQVQQPWEHVTSGFALKDVNCWKDFQRLALFCLCRHFPFEQFVLLVEIAPFSPSSGPGCVGIG